ncbi:hypothetical protein P879_01724 [Paragonimus westermani]|uniref:Transporter n=1 Tax=Paragonimus westermani TaxID=34504 RepID=A0A8T0DXD0_9TREM|nr:hypothetical protein P879_01724 [Paragonimus westermani]
MSHNVPPPYAFVPPEQMYARDSRTMICGPYRINTVTAPSSHETYEDRPKILGFHDPAEHPPVASWAQPGREHPAILGDPAHYGYQVNHRVFAPNVPLKMGSNIQIVEPVTNLNYGDTKQISTLEVTPMTMSENEPDVNAEQQVGSSREAEVQITYGRHANRETWDTKIDFLLAVIGFAVDLGNIWRFPYVCYRNGGGIGFGICIIASYTAWYYNTVMAWALFYMFDAMRPSLPWDSCNNWWNTNSCITVYKQFVNMSSVESDDGNDTNYSHPSSDLLANQTIHYSSTEEYFYRRVLQIQYATGYNSVGPIRWEIAMCLMVIFTIVYFSLWKGVKSSGKAVWITATLPYVILSILLVRGLTLEGSLKGIKYYLTPHFASLLEVSVWKDAASQIFFSLGPGFGVLLALSSYNKFHNNCYRDAMLTSFINCATSFLSGFVVFSVLGHMCNRMNKSMEEVANEGPGLVFIAYPEAIATLKGSTFWAIIFMLMLITLGLDSTFGGLEAIITAVLDKIPSLRRRREVFVLIIIIYCFTGALATTTCGGYLILTLLDTHGAPISILFIVFCECVALCWFYGTKRFCADIRMMLGFTPGKFWQICWTFISPLFLLSIFIANLVYYEFKPISVMGVIYEPHTWVIVTAWLIVFSSLIFIPIMMVVQLARAKGTLKERLRYLITPEARPVLSAQKMQITDVEDNAQHEKGIENPLSAQKLKEAEPI